MNEIIVTKFGGSSLASAQQFKKVKDIILANPNRKFVVPSAPGKRNSKDYKITDVLYLCYAHIKSGVPFDDIFKLIEERYLNIIDELQIDINLKPYLKTIKEKIESGASADYIASRGEYLNGLILSKYIGFDFVDAADIIVFDEDRSYNRAKTREKINKLLSNRENVVIPGFYGANEEGDIITFSRGGSDITGSIISSGINANLYENWTDVSGFLMADPRIVKAPKTIETISYKELRELSYMGASVLHEEAIFPVREKNIPIRIKNTNRPNDPGTLIVDELSKDSKALSVTGIAGRKDFTVISIYKALMNSVLGFCRKVLSILENKGVSFENMPAGIDTVCLVIDSSKLNNKLNEIVDEIKMQCNPDSIEVNPNMSVIATVGRGMAKTPGIAAKIFNAVYEANINIKMIDQGSSEMNILIGIDNSDFEKATNAIYNAFVK